MDRRAVGGEVEDALEKTAGVTRARGAFAQRHALGHLDDPERGQLAGPRIEERGAEPDQLLRGGRVCDRDEDAGRERAARRARGGAHRWGPAAERPDVDAGREPLPFEVDAAAWALAVGAVPAASACSQRSTRYGFSSSNSRAWRSTRSSAWSVVWWRFSITK